MRRVFTISGADGDSAVRVKVTLDTHKLLLTRDEVEHMVQDLATDIMRALPNVPHSGFTLPTLKVTGVS